MYFQLVFLSAITIWEINAKISWLMYTLIIKVFMKIIYNS